VTRNHVPDDHFAVVAGRRQKVWWAESNGRDIIRVTTTLLQHQMNGRTQIVVLEKLQIHINTAEMLGIRKSSLEVAPTTLAQRIQQTTN